MGLPSPPSHHHSHAVCKNVEEKSALLGDISIWCSFLRTHYIKLFLFFTFTCKPAEWVARLKTQTCKTETLENENSDPKKSDSLCVSKTQSRKISQLFFAACLLWIASRHLIWCSSIQCDRHNLQREGGKKQPMVVDSFARITKIIPSIRIFFWLLYKYKPNWWNLFYT